MRCCIVDESHHVACNTADTFFGGGTKEVFSFKGNVEKW